MKSMRNIFKCLELCLLLVLCLALTACASDTAQSAESAPPVQAEETLTPTPMPTEPPAYIELVSGKEIEWPCGIPFEEPGFKAVDSKGEDKSEAVSVEGEIIPWKSGEYTLKYSFTDERDGLVFVERIVKLVPAEHPEEVPTEKVIYLSFDDGPCSNTAYILELLAKYDAKATFFIIAEENKYSDLIPQMEEQGHTVAIHCSYHDYASIYASEEAFFEDFMKAQDFYYSKLGHYATISRFPGGAITAESYLNKNVKDGFNKVAQSLRDMGVRYFDWDIQESETSTLETYYIFRAQVPKFQHPVILQHDARSYSIGALEEMLIWGTENGYKFQAITETTPQRAYEKPMAYY